MKEYNTERPDNTNQCLRYRKPRKPAGQCTTAHASTNTTSTNNFVNAQINEKPCSSNYATDFKMRQKFKTTIITASMFIIILFTSNNRFMTHAAVARIPRFLDIEQALESSKCTVREEVVDIRKIHPTLPPNAIYMPSCVVVNRCSGCCQSDLLQCKPTSTYVTKVKISQQMLDPHGYDEIVLEFTQHDTCECKRFDDTTPVCVQKDCEGGQVWSAQDCACVARSASLCQPRECGIGESWSDATCQCEPACAPRNCIPGEMWNATSCSCVRTCPIERCPYGQMWDIFQCACVQRCPAQECGKHQFWNPERCRCQCKPCHPRRVFHARFNQNLQTCQCTCQAEPHGRAVCRKRGYDFDTKTCTCDYPYAKHRGKRG
ncbi:uncharacterized protein LOC120326297 [Styela clava]